MKHKVVRIDNLMYNGCEPHWKCVKCGKAVPFHCYTKEQFENQECNITDKQNKSEVDKLIELFQDTEHKHWLRDNADMKEFAEKLKLHSYIMSDESQTGIINRYSVVTVNQIDNILKELVGNER